MIHRENKRHPHLLHVTPFVHSLHSSRRFLHAHFGRFLQSLRVIQPLRKLNRSLEQQVNLGIIILLGVEGSAGGTT